MALPIINGGTGGTGITGPIPPGASGAEFETTYTIVAHTIQDIERIQLTFCDFNESRRIRFFQEAFNVVWKQDTEESLDLKSFFHPLQDFSGFQNQTFAIQPLSYFYFDPGYFAETNDQIGFLFARAYYLPEAGEYKEMYWSYGPDGKEDPDCQNYVMGDFLSLSGAIKEGATGNAWNSKGFYFTNPTEYVVKLKIITAN